MKRTLLLLQLQFVTLFLGFDLAVTGDALAEALSYSYAPLLWQHFWLIFSITCVMAVLFGFYVWQFNKSLNANQEIKKKPSKIPQPNSWGFYDVIESDLLNCVDKTEVPK
jgi:hypothetical protein